MYPLNHNHNPCLRLSTWTTPSTTTTTKMTVPTSSLATLRGRSLQETYQRLWISGTRILDQSIQPRVQVHSSPGAALLHPRTIIMPMEGHGHLPHSSRHRHRTSPPCHFRTLSTTVQVMKRIYNSLQTLHRHRRKRQNRRQSLRTIPIPVFSLMPRQTPSTAFIRLLRANLIPQSMQSLIYHKSIPRGMA